MPAGLLHVLETARLRGLLGPADLQTHCLQAEGFGRAVPRNAEFVDLGCGGGVPGLPLLVNRPDLSGVLIDASRRRVEFLDWAIEELALEGRVRAVWGRAEDLARSEELRGCVPIVLSRSFGPPAVAAECARGFLSEGGFLIVSEPPAQGADDLVASGSQARWQKSPLSSMGYEVGSAYRHQGFGFQILVASGECPEGIPRRAGIPTKRPRF